MSDCFLWLYPRPRGATVTSRFDLWTSADAEVQGSNLRGALLRRCFGVVSKCPVFSLGFGYLFLLRLDLLSGLACVFDAFL